MVHNEFPYLNALRAVLEHGNNRLTRNGLTRAILAYQMRFDLTASFPLLTTKEVRFNSIKAENLWFIDAGKETNYRLSLQKLNEIQGKKPDAKNIWSHDQARFASLGKEKFPGDCGRIYGAQWRNWNGEIDQLAKVIDQLKKDPFSRYHIINAWNPSEIGDMCLPPCHMKMQFFAREVDGKLYLDLSMDQRSCDMFLGVPFNIASYALFVHMVAQCVDMTPGELVITLEDCHIYLAGINNDGNLNYEKGHEAQVLMQLEREPLKMPTLRLNPKVKNIDDFKMEDIELLDYQHHPKIEAALL